MAWSGLLVLVVTCVSKFSLPGGGLYYYFFILFFTIVAGFGIYREYEDSSYLVRTQRSARYPSEGDLFELQYGKKSVNKTDIGTDGRAWHLAVLPTFVLPGNVHHDSHVCIVRQ